jgi:CheY-like chemotaxis protein
LEFINKRSPDVAFLDVEMPEMSGMAFLDIPAGFLEVKGECQRC